MSGPVSTDDLVAGGAATTAATVEVLEGRPAVVGGMPVVRLLPKRQHRTVGAWCFVDHFGPSRVADASMQVGPHPHIGLQTVTWVLDGEVVHTDSLGSEQPIRPGQLNLMTAGQGIAHAEQTPERVSGDMHGVQLWVAQPDSTRFGAAAFEHHAVLPQVELAGGTTGTVLAGAFAGMASPARTDTPLVGVDLVVRGSVTIPLDPSFEHGLTVIDGAVTVAGAEATPGRFLYLGLGREDVVVEPVGGGRGAGGGASRLLLLGGEPFGEEIAMWWNFVARSTDELEAAYRDWSGRTDRFGPVESSLARIDAPRPHWRSLT